jgi:DNA polymerase-3 subunit beta
MNTFIFTPKTLIKALQIVSKAFPSFNSCRVPILQNFLFQVTGNVLRISVNDLSITFSVSMPVVSKGNFKAIVPQECLKYLTKIKSDTATFTWIAESFSAEFNYGTERAKYSGDEPNDFPAAAIAETELFTVTAGLFQQFKTMLAFVSDDALRSAHTGISIIPQGKEMKLMATNAHYLRAETLPNAFHAVGFIYPAKPAKILSGLKLDVSTPVTVFVDGVYLNTRMTFSSDGFDFEMITRNIDEKAPNYAAVIPDAESATTWMDVSKGEFLEAIDKSLLFAHPTTKLVSIHLNGKASIQAVNLDESKEITIDLPTCSKRGNDIVMGFNAELLQTVVKAHGDAFTIEFMKVNRCLAIRNESAVTILMPVMLEG